MTNCAIWLDKLRNILIAHLMLLRPQALVNRGG